MNQKGVQYTQHSVEYHSCIYIYIYAYTKNGLSLIVVHVLLNLLPRAAQAEALKCLCCRRLDLNYPLHIYASLQSIRSLSACYAAVTSRTVDYNTNRGGTRFDPPYCCYFLGRSKQAARELLYLHMGFAGQGVVDGLILAGAALLAVVGCCYVAMMWRLR